MKIKIGAGLIVAGLLAVIWSMGPREPAPAVSVIEEEPYREVDWIELMPEDDLQALMSPPDWMTDIVDGSDEDDLRLLSSPRADDSGEARFFEALESAEIVTAMDNTRIRIPGFIVPLAYDNRQRTIEFFLVPYFGACLHLPPPPPNQIIYVNYELGIDQHSMYEPVWVEGVLRAQPVSNAVANAAYRLNASVITPYHDTSGY